LLVCACLLTGSALPGPALPGPALPCPALPIQASLTSGWLHKLNLFATEVLLVS